MDTSTVLTIASIAITLLLGGYTIWLTFRNKRYPGRITYVNENTIALFDALVRDLPELSVSYEDDKVGENLVLLKGFLLNTGTKDISPEMIERQITLTIPEGFRWLTAKVVSSSPNFNVEATVAGNREVRFETTSLFRCREHVRFQVLAEVPNNDTENQGKANLAQSLRSELGIEYRIAETQQIDRQDIKTDRQLRQSTRMIILAGIYFIVFCSMFSYIGIPVWRKTSQVGINYIITSDDSKQIEVKLRAAMDGTVKVSGVDTDFEETMSIESFFANYTLQPKIARNSAETVILFLTAFTALLSGISIPIYLRQKQKDTRLRKLLSLYDQQGPETKPADKEKDSLSPSDA